MQFLQEPLQSVMGALSAYPYLALFLGLLVAGELILLPAIYLASTGRLEILPLLSVAFVATMISDVIWYGLGRRFPAPTLQRMSGRMSERFLAGVEAAFNAGGKRLLFLSKFVYGSRTLMQVLAGIHQMPLRTYIWVNAAGVLAVTAVLTLIAYSIVGTSYRFSELVQDMEVAFLAFVLVSVTGFLLVSKKLRAQWSL